MEVDLTAAREKAPRINARGSSPTTAAIHCPRFQGVHPPVRDDANARRAPTHPQRRQNPRWHGNAQLRDRLRPTCRCRSTRLGASSRSSSNITSGAFASAIGYVAPADKLAGREPLLTARDQKLAAANKSASTSTQLAVVVVHRHRGTQRKRLAGVQGTAMSPLVRPNQKPNQPHAPRGRNQFNVNSYPSLTAHNENSISR